MIGPTRVDATMSRRRNARAADGPDSMAWQLHREMALLAGWGRAILLQLAHPLVAQGVDAHSGFCVEPRGRSRRLARTLGAMLALTFGTPDEVAAAARRINGVHDRVHGALSTKEGAFPAGLHYSAHDPALLAWVQATLVDSLLLTYELFVAPLGGEERDRYCAESCRIEPLLGIPSGSLPRSAGELRAYMGDMLASGDIEVTDTARRLAQEILYPPTLLIGAPLLALARLPTIGLLPLAIRRGYRLSWGSGHERTLLALAALSRHLLPLLPSALRHWPAARRALARARRLERLP